MTFSKREVALGAWVPGCGTDPTVMDAYGILIGSKPKIAMWYMNWQNIPDFPHSLVRAYASKGIRSLITWNAPANLEVISGIHDPFITQWAKDAAAYNKPFYLRYGPEMNGNWTAWSVGFAGNTAASYIQAWQHVHDIFIKNKATKVRWIWCPNTEYIGSTPFADMYPGNAYVDWVGLDGYNWGPSDQWHSWTSLYDLFAPSYASLQTLTKKPMMIGETASSEIGGDKAAWITQGFYDIFSKFPLIKAVQWFDENKEKDWRINSSPASLVAFQTVAQSIEFQGKLP